MTPGRGFLRGTRIPAKRVNNFGFHVSAENELVKLEGQYWQVMKVHFRKLNSVARALAQLDCSDEQLSDVTKHLAAQLGTSDLLAPEEKATRAHKPAASCSDATKTARLERWEKDIGGDKEGETHLHGHRL